MRLASLSIMDYSTFEQTSNLQVGALVRLRGKLFCSV